MSGDSPRNMRQSRIAAASGWIGSALEYYDFFIYATAAALVFPQIFFPSANPTVAIVASLATYGVGYVARPIGAFVLGHWGDTHGRKNVLVLCMFLMGFSTMLVGVLPTYEHVGILAPVFLVALRLIQGFAVAGEISGASSMVLEHAPFGRRGFFASFTLQGVQAGQILAAAVFLPIATYMGKDDFIAWGWRIPFLLSFFVHRHRLSDPARGRRDAGLRRGKQGRRAAFDHAVSVATGGAAPPSTVFPPPWRRSAFAWFISMVRPRLMVLRHHACSSRNGMSLPTATALPGWRGRASPTRWSTISGSPIPRP